MAIGDTIVPAVESASVSDTKQLGTQPSEYSSAVASLESRQPSTSNTDLIHSYLAESVSSIPGAREVLNRVLCDYLRTDVRNGISVVLSALK